MLLNTLTPRAAQRLAAIGDAVEDAQNAVLAVQRRMGETEHAMRHTSEDQTEQFALLDREHARHRQRLVAAQNTFSDIVRVHTAIRSWLNGLPRNVTLDDIDDEHAEVHAGEDYTDAANRVRSEIEQLTAAHRAIARAVLPLDELYRQAEEHVDSLAARGRPPLRLDRDKLVVGTPPDPVAMLAWLHADTLKERLLNEIEAQRKHETHESMIVLSSAERKDRLRVLDEAILRLERQEEAIIREAGEQGTTIPRRERASPLAILGLRVVPRVRAPKEVAA